MASLIQLRFDKELEQPNIVDIELLIRNRIDESQNLSSVRSFRFSGGFDVACKANSVNCKLSIVKSIPG